MKRKIILIPTLLLVTVFCVLFVGCQGGCNKEIFDLQYSYDRAYVKVGNGWKDIPIKKWTDYEGEQLQLTLKDGSKMLVSSVNCILYYGELP